MRSRLSNVVTVVLLAIGGLPQVCRADGNEPSVPYEAHLKGLRRGALRDAVVAQSQTIALADRPPATWRQLEKRVDADLPPMIAALRADGYLDATVTSTIVTNRSPALVFFDARKGPRYAIDVFQVVYTNATASVPYPPKRLGLKVGSPAAVKRVEDAEAAARRYLQEHGYPDPQKRDRRIARDAVRKTVAVTCVIDPGAKATLGAAGIHGRVRVRAAYLRRRITWEPGDPYDIEVLESLEKDLLNAGLFQSARVTVSNATDAAGHRPVDIRVVERPFRTVRAGISYYTDEGVGGQASWEHRNLLGGGEGLALTLYGSEIDMGARSTYTRPDFTARDVDLLTEIEVKDEHPDAYDSRSARLALSLEKRLDHGITLTGGTAAELDTVEQQGIETRHSLISVPLSAGWDGRDDKLDPTKGAALHLATAPYRDLRAELAFLKSVAELSTHLRVWDSPRTVWAARAMVGSISGEAAANVPADKRFYAGGGGTIRGYAYQSVGQLVDGEPIGGDALAVVSSELRARLTRNLGAAAFVDGGTAYSDPYPDTEIPFLWGVGGGVRYYLGFAPLRLDVGFPLNRRAGIDDAFQIYVSLGQSF